MIDIGDLTTRNAWRSPGRDAIIDVPNGRRLSFAQLEERAEPPRPRAPRGARHRTRGARRDPLDERGRDRGDLLRLRQGGPRRDAAQLAPRGARAGADPGRRRSPAALIHNRAFAGDVAELQRRNDIAHWIEFAPGSDSRLRGAARPRPGGSASVERRDGRRRPVLHPLHGRHHRHLEGRPPQPRVVLRGHGQPGRGGADRGRRRLHAARPDVPHPRRARDDLPRPRQAGRADELRAERDAAGDRGRAGERLPRDHDDAQLHDGGRRLRPLRPLVAAADQVRRRADGRRASCARSWSASRAT